MATFLDIPSNAAITISGGTFVEGKNYRNIIFQGIGKRPVLDTELNELQEYNNNRQSELLKLLGNLFIGDGFKVIEDISNNKNNFMIKTGRGFFKNDFVYLPVDKTYVSQTDVTDSILRQFYWNSTIAMPIAMPALTTPDVARKDLVVLNLVIKEIFGADDIQIINPNLNKETAARSKIFIGITVLENYAEYPDYSNFLNRFTYENNEYCFRIPLAWLNRDASENITEAMIEDIRFRRITSDIFEGIEESNSDKVDGRDVDDSKTDNASLWTAEKIIEYIRLYVKGLDPQANVLDILTGDQIAELVSPTEGDRYICNTTGSGFVINTIYQRHNDAWEATTPNDGFYLKNSTDNNFYIYDSDNAATFKWVDIGKFVSHADLEGLNNVIPNGEDSTTYKHLTDTQVGNASGKIPISNGTLNVNLNSDNVDGYGVDNTGFADNEILLVDETNKKIITSNKVLGNADGNVPISNGTLNVNLNSDNVDGYGVDNAGFADNEILLVDETNKKIKTSNLLIGNASGNVPLSNGTVNGNLNADKLDGYDIYDDDAVQGDLVAFDKTGKKLIKGSNTAMPESHLWDFSINNLVRNGDFSLGYTSKKYWELLNGATVSLQEQGRITGSVILQRNSATLEEVYKQRLDGVFDSFYFSENSTNILRRNITISLISKRYMSSVSSIKLKLVSKLVSDDSVYATVESEYLAPSYHLSKTLEIFTLNPDVPFYIELIICFDNYGSGNRVLISRVQAVFGIVSGGSFDAVKDLIEAPSSSVSDNIPIFDNIYGNKLKDSGKAVDDTQTTTSYLWTASKITSELGLKVSKAGDSMSGKLTITSGGEEITGDVILHDTLKIYNPAETFTYNFVTSAITANRNVTLPVLAGNGIFIFDIEAQTISGIKYFSNGLKTTKIYPNADSTTAILVTKADGATSIVTVDTTNERVGVGITPVGKFHVHDSTGGFFGLNISPTESLNNVHFTIAPYRSGGTSYVNLINPSGSDTIALCFYNTDNTENTTILRSATEFKIGGGSTARDTVFYDGSTTEVFRISATDRSIKQENNGTVYYSMYSFRNNNDHSYLIGYAARGTKALPLALIADDELIGLAGFSHNGTGWSASQRAGIWLKTSETQTLTANGTKIDFYTTLNGTTTTAIALTIGNDGSLTAANKLTVNAGGATITGAIELLGQTLIGSKSGSALYNTQIGFEAGQPITTGAYNLVLGWRSGKTMSPTSAGNVFIGMRAGYSLGTFGTNIPNGNIAIGSDSLYWLTTKNDAYSGEANIAIGTEAFRGHDANGFFGSFSIAIGHKAGSFATNTTNVTTTGNIFIGRESGYNYQGNLNTVQFTGNYNIGLGHRTFFGNDTTLLGLTTAAGNIAIGVEVFNKITSGQYNIGLGYQTFGGNNSGNYNIAAGYQAAYSGGVTGEYNTILGYKAGYVLASGSENILIGKNAGNTITTGSGNIIIGDNVGSAALENTTLIGNTTTDRTIVQGFIQSLKGITQFGGGGETLNPAQGPVTWGGAWEPMAILPTSEYTAHQKGYMPYDDILRNYDIKSLNLGWTVLKDVAGNGVFSPYTITDIQNLFNDKTSGHATFDSLGSVNDVVTIELNILDYFGAAVSLGGFGLVWGSNNIAQDVKLEYYNSKTGYVGWWTALDSTNNTTRRNVYYLNYAGSNQSNQIVTKIKFTFKNWQAITAGVNRLTRLFMYALGTSGVHKQFLSSRGGNIYGNIAQINSELFQYKYSSVLTACPAIAFMKSKATTNYSNPVTTTAGDILGQVNFWGTNYAATPAFVQSSWIRAVQSSNMSSGNTYVPSDIIFGTGTNLAGPVERMRITSNGYILLGTKSGATAYNTQIGYQAGYSITTGTYNICIGASVISGNSDTTGELNIALGRNTMREVLSGSYNIALGEFALDSCYTSSYNIAIGYAALSSIGSASTYNIGLGHRAGQGKAGADNKGPYNICIGFESGYFLSTAAESNIFLGKYSGYGDATNGLTGLHNIGLGCQALTGIYSGTYNIGLGYQALSGITTGQHNIGIGYQTGKPATNAIGSVYMGYMSGATLSGSYNTAIGYATCGGWAGSTQAGANNTAIGKNCLQFLTTGTYNTAIGQSCGIYLSSGYENVFIGTNSAGTGVVTGHNNVGIGKHSINSITSGYYNVAIGKDTLKAITTNSDNVAIGNTALMNLAGTYGNANVAIGPGAGLCKAGATVAMTGNLCLGWNSGYNLYNGAQHNIFIGTDSGYCTSGLGMIGIYNVGIGYQSLYSIETGDNNVVIGRQSGLYLKSSDNSVFIGGLSGSGDSTYGPGKENVCVGYKSGFLLNQTSTPAIGYAALNTLLGSYAGQYLTTGRNNIFIGNNAGSSFTTETYNIVIGELAGVAASSSGTYIANIYGTTVNAGVRNVYIDSAGKLGGLSSSLRYKENIYDVGTVLDKVMLLKPVHYSFITDPNKESRYGLIAEWTYEVFSDFVFYKDGLIEGVNYDYLPIVLLKAIQEQQYYLEGNKKELEDLKARVLFLESKIA